MAQSRSLNGRIYSPDMAGEHGYGRVSEALVRRCGRCHGVGASVDIKSALPLMACTEALLCACNGSNEQAPPLNPQAWGDEFAHSSAIEPGRQVSLGTPNAELPRAYSNPSTASSSASSSSQGPGLRALSGRNTWRSPAPAFPTPSAPPAIRTTQPRQVCRAWGAIGCSHTFWYGRLAQGLRHCPVFARVASAAQSTVCRAHAVHAGCYLLEPLHRAVVFSIKCHKQALACERLSGSMVGPCAHARSLLTPAARCMQAALRKRAARLIQPVAVFHQPGGHGQRGKPVTRIVAAGNQCGPQHIHVLQLRHVAEIILRVS